MSKLSAEELHAALNDVSGSPVYEDRKRARSKLFDHIAALERELEHAREEAAKWKRERAHNLTLFWQAVRFAGGQFRMDRTATAEAPDDLVLVDYGEGDQWVIEATTQAERDARLSPSELAGDSANIAGNVQA